MTKIVMKKGATGGLYQTLKKARQSPDYYAEDLKLKVADAIISLMKNQGVNRTKLAEKIETSPPNITKALRGYTNLRLETMANLAFALGYRWEVTLVPREEGVSLFWMTSSVSSWGDIEDNEQYEQEITKACYELQQSPTR